MISEVLVNATLKLKFRISDENQDPLSYKVYLVYRNNDSEITNVVEKDDGIEISWKAYAVETMGLKFKIVVSDGKVETLLKRQPLMLLKLAITNLLRQHVKNQRLVLNVG